jgi:RNA polymerase sigma-70 factor (ECF subfamily)
MEMSVLALARESESVDVEGAATAVHLAGVAGGDPAALAALYDATSRQVYGLALRILRDRGEAEEVALDVYLHVWQGAGRYDAGRGSVETWLCTLARSRAIDRLRARVRHDARHSALDAADGLEDAAPGPETEVVQNDTARRVRRALGALPSEQRRAVAAAYFGGLSYAEVARVLGEPEGTVKTRIRVALSTLRTVLGGE